MNASQVALYEFTDKIKTYGLGEIPPAWDRMVSCYDYLALRSLAFRLLESVPLEQLSTLEIAEYLARRVAFDERKIRENAE